MMNYCKLICVCLLIFSQPLMADALSARYATLDPTSVAQHFAFYELYPDTPQGHNALQHAWELLSGCGSECDFQWILPSVDIQPIISLIHRSSEETSPVLNEEQILIIENLGKHLHNRSLQGFNLWDEAAILHLSPEQVDIARGLLLAEMGTHAKMKIKSYEAMLDLMALQILARLPLEAAPKQKLRAINDYIFSELRFRFPPHSLHAKDIDLYTFLPSVLDSRKGVCLGVSILYLSLAQRLNLPLESITPPGHIYVRYNDGNGDIVNIETTARGIDIPSEHYLGVETKSLQQRNLKEVIGLAFMNQAAVSWHKGDPQTAVLLYEKAQPFLPNDYLLNMFLGFNYLFIGKEKEGRALLQKVEPVIPSHAVTKDTVSEDFLAGRTDVEGIQAIFSEIGPSRSSILQKQKRIENTLAKYPLFRQGHFHLAITYLQLGREKEALPILEHYVQLSPKDPTAQYYLSAIHFQRHNHLQAWKYLKAADTLVKAQSHHPKALKELRSALERACPEPL